MTRVGFQAEPTCSKLPPMSKAAKVVAGLKVDDLTERQAKAEHKRLGEEIRHHDVLYHDKDAPEISDADYDRLRVRLKAIEARFPQLVDLLSPTQQVAPTPTTAFAKVRHARPMLSLDAKGRREEIARMLSGAEVTAEARAAADRLLATAG